MEAWRLANAAAFAAGLTLLPGASIQTDVSHGQNSFKGEYRGTIWDPEYRVAGLYIRSFDHG